MQFNFDEIIPRENTDCLKYDERLGRFGNANVQPLWVADMDFRVPPCVTEEFNRITSHGIYGYQIKTNKHFNAIINWYSKRHQYSPDARGIIFTPGLVAALSYLIQCFTEKDDEIIVQSPVYYPFFSVVSHNGRKLVINQLLENNNCYSINFDDFEIKAKSAKMFILCSPHNPVGRVWSREELTKIAEICLRNNVIIVADEIHNDLVFGNFKHIPIASLSPEIDNITITCHAPSKTFNLAGLSAAYVFLRNEKMQNLLQRHLSNLHIDALTPFGMEGMVVAYNLGEPWLAELMEYLKGNYEMIVQFLQKELPMLKISPLEATYLLWIDFRALLLKDEELKHFIIDKAGLGLNNGPVFGAGGSGFQRMNIACPRASLVEALNKLKRAIG